MSRSPPPRLEALRERVRWSHAGVDVCAIPVAVAIPPTHTVRLAEIGKRPAARATVGRDGVTVSPHSGILTHSVSFYQATWTSCCRPHDQISVRVFGPKIYLVLHDDDDDDDDDDD